MLQINNERLIFCYNNFSKIDNEWIKRRRKINTKDIFDTLSFSASTNSGISTNVSMLCDYSHVALIKAREKLPEQTFKKVNDMIHSEILERNHIYAVDGSKVKMLKGKEKYGYTSRTNCEYGTYSAVSFHDTQMYQDLQRNQYVCYLH